MSRSQTSSLASAGENRSMNTLSGRNRSSQYSLGSKMTEQGFQPGTVSNPTTKLELKFKCTGLQTKDFGRKGDPQVYVYLKDKVHDLYTLLGNTEIIKDTANPVFISSVDCDFRFEEHQVLRILAMNISKVGGGPQAQELMGACFTTLNEIVSSPGMSQRITLKNEKKNKNAGVLYITAEEMAETQKTITMRFHATDLDGRSLFAGKVNPFLRIYRQREANEMEYDAAFRTELIKGSQNPGWKKFVAPIQKICNGDIDRTLRLDCVDYSSNGSESVIGSCTTSVRFLQELAVAGAGQPLINEKKKEKKKSYQNSGMLHCTTCDLQIENTFVDYVRGGMEIGLMIGVDFTASNGPIEAHDSLHHTSDQDDRPNDYVCAMTAIGQVLACYDSDNKFPAYGFGARLPPDGEISHCFPLNWNEDQPEIHTIERVVDHYAQTAHGVQFFGPTHFAEIVDKAIDYSKGCTAKEQKYTILLILTDGVIQDMQTTVDKIVQASDLPLSIVIVGIGEADFSNMDVLDADDNPLVASNGRVMSRDIVQFVPFREVKDSYIERIAELTLEEIPDQLVGYMRANNIQPNPPLPANHNADLTSLGNSRKSFHMGNIPAFNQGVRKNTKSTMTNHALEAALINSTKNPNPLRSSMYSLSTANLRTDSQLGPPDANGIGSVSASFDVKAPRHYPPPKKTPRPDL